MTERGSETSSSVDRAGHHTALPAGTMIGRYSIVSVLGQGGFGITYLCHDTQLHRDVAIKEYLPCTLAVRQDGTTVLPRSTEMSRDFVWGRSRFLDEARTVARLGDAPAVVHVHDFLEAHGTAYVVMQFLEGETLEQRLQREPRLSQSEIERILPPLLDGLEQIHTVGFLHRDIKPANIMLAHDGLPTLIDFGSARVAIAGRSQAMTAVFTPGYAAPEQSTSGQQGPWTDIYGLAATLYTCVNGQPPPSVMDRVFESASVAGSEATTSDYSPALLAAIDAGLQLQANARPRSIAVWRRVLATGVWNVPPAATAARQSAPPPPQSSTRPRASFWPAAALCLGLLVGAIGGYAVLAPSAVSLAVAVAPPETASVVGATLQQEPEARQESEWEPLAESADMAARIAEEARTRAERAEADLKLTSRDRQKLQIALGAVGFDVAGIDGTFGPRSRQMIGAWQARRGDPATGHFTAEQMAALLSDGGPAITRWEEAQRRAYAEERRRQQQQLQQQQPAPEPPPPPPRSGWRWPWE